MSMIGTEQYMDSTFKMEMNHDETDNWIALQDEDTVILVLEDLFNMYYEVFDGYKARNKVIKGRDYSTVKYRDETDSPYKLGSWKHLSTRLVGYYILI